MYLFFSYLCIGIVFNVYIYGEQCYEDFCTYNLMYTSQFLESIYLLMKFLGLKLCLLFVDNDKLFP